MAQAVTLVATPILSRVYPPEAFGFLTMVVSVTGMLAPAVALRFESALMLPRRQDEASALLFLGLLCVATVSVLSVVTLEILFGLGLLGAMSSLPGFSWWVGGITLLSGAFVIFGQYALRSHKYSTVGIRNITQAIVTAASQLSMALVTLSGLGLVAGYALGRAGGLMPLAFSARADLRRFRYQDVRAVLRRYWRFPALFAPAALLNAGALALPIICAGLWFDVSDAGQWGMAERVLALPLVIVATALGQVVEARLANHARDRASGCVQFFARVSMFLALFSLLVAAVVLAVAPLVVP